MDHEVFKEGRIEATVVRRIDCFEQKTFVDIYDYLVDLIHL